MVYESRVGDVFTLGSTSWRIEDISHDRVLVTPAPGPAGPAAVLEGRHPRPAGRARPGARRVHPRARRAVAGEGPGAGDGRRARRLGRRQPAGLPRRAARRRPATCPTTARSSSSGSATSSATGGSRSTRRSARRCTRRGRWPSRPGCASGTASTCRRCTPTTASCCGCPTSSSTTGDALPRTGTEMAVVEPDEVEPLVTAEVGGSALFAVPVPRVRGPGPAAAAAQPRPAHAAVAAAAAVGAAAVGGQRLRLVPGRARDDARVPAGRLRRARAGRADARGRRSARCASSRSRPSSRRRSPGRCCSATSRSSSTRATRRWPSAGPPRCRSTRRCSPSCSASRGTASCASCSTPTPIASLARDLQRLSDDRRARDVEGVADLLRVLGPLTTAEAVDRGATPGLAGRARGGPAGDPGAGRRRGALGRGRGRRAAARRARHPAADGHPRRVPRAAARPDRRPGRAVRPHPRAVPRPATWRPGSASGPPWSSRPWPGSPAPAGWWPASSCPAVRAPSGATPRCCARCGAGRWPRCARRSSRSRSRRWPRSCPPGSRSAAGCAARRACCASSSSCRARRSRRPRWSRWCCRSGCRTTPPRMLDELCAAGEVLWRGHGSLPGSDGWVSLHLADSAPLTLPAPDPAAVSTPVHQAVLDALAGGGAFFFRRLADVVGSSEDADRRTTRPWSPRSGTWSGRVTSATTPWRRCAPWSRAAAARTRPAGRRPRGRYGRSRPAMPSRTGPPVAAGRWSLLPERRGRPDPAGGHARRGAARPARRGDPRRGHGRARTRRVRRGLPGARGLRGDRPLPPRLLRRGPRRGAVRPARGGRPAARGRRPRSSAPARVRGRPAPTYPRALVLAATDPANPFGAALPWPGRGEDAGHKPGRKAGALVVLVDGRLVLYVERGGRTLLTWADEPGLLQPAVDALSLAVREGQLGRLTVERADGAGVLDSPLGRALEEAGFHATPRGLRLRG